MDWSIDNISEDLDDQDEFANEEFWHRTFRSLIDEGGLELVAHALRTHFPSDRVLEVDGNSVLIAVTLEAGSEDFRKLKIPFDLNYTLRDWLSLAFLPALKKAEREKDQITKEHHPLFFEDLSPWGNEMGKPWGWQISVAPVVPDQSSASGEGLDDQDEFLTGDENYIVTVSNKHYPNREVAGVVGFQEGKHFPEVLNLNRNDWEFSEEFAVKLIWSAWWASDEARHGEPSYEAKDLEPGEMLQMDRGGIEMLKYYNDPEHYNKEINKEMRTEAPPGWGKVGTHTYGEGHETPFTKYVNGKIFTNVYEQDLMNLFMNTWYWTYPGAPDTLYKSPDEIMDDYPKLFIHWAMPIDMSEFYETTSLPPPPENVEPDSVDDRDEFDVDDPEVDLQKWEDAERLAASEARTRMLKEFATIDPGYKLLYVGAKSTLDKKMKPYAIITRVAVTEDLDDKDEFGGQCSYCGGGNDLKPIVTSRFDHYLICNLCRNQEWYHNAIARRDLKLESVGGYELKIVCGWCKKPLGSKPTDAPQDHGKISHGICRDCEVEQYKQLGVEPPPPVTENLDDKDEFVPTDPNDICSRCDTIVGRENMVPVSSDPIYGDLAGIVCKQCREILDQGPQDDRWLREDIDDKDEFISQKNFIHAWVKWPEGKFAGPDEAVAAALDVMVDNGYQITVEDIATFRSTNKDLPDRWRYEKVGVYCYATNDLIETLKSDGDLTFGSTQREPWVAFSIDVGDNEKYFPTPDPDDYPRRNSFYMGWGNYDESIDNIAHTINEDITIDLAGFLNSRKVTPWTYAPGAGNSARFSARPGHEGECVDEESGLMDHTGKDVTKEYENQMIYTYIASWTPPQKPKEAPLNNPDLLDDEDEFYSGETECVVFASLGKYSPEMDQAVFYNGHWQTVE